MKLKVIAAILAASVAVTSPAFAHHSYASFNMMAVKNLKGTVKEFHYTNPHVWIVFLVEDADGKTTEATVEANGPGYLVKAGWNRKSLSPGDKVTLSVNPMRSGAPGGNLLKVTYPDGRTLSTM